MTFPANDLARVTGVKSTDCGLETPRDFERFLREHGFSRTRAKAITAKGFGGFEETDSAAIAELVTQLKERQRLLQRKGGFGLDKFGPVGLALTFLGKIRRIAREEVNQISVQPGGSGTARIVSVSPGKVTFEITPPMNMPDAKFSCTIDYYKIVDNKRVEPDSITLTHNHLSEDVDRGILKAAVPSIRLQDIEAYFDDLALNAFKGTTKAKLKVEPFPPGHPHQLERPRGVFKIKAINWAVDQMKIERAIEQYRRRHPELFDPR